MKNIYNLLCFSLLLTISTFISGCEIFDVECVADIVVTALDAPAAVTSGNPIAIVCVIKNTIKTASSCATEENVGTVTVTCGYSPTYQGRFSGYKVFEENTYALSDTLFWKQIQEDEMIMETNFGSGFYAMKVEVESPLENPGDVDDSNARAIAIEAD